ncbi:MAG TPA: aspartyl/asparaginyl beta-hydroxylase domain-containing protein [Myxococcaceae bacterium]|nr:aspartyl/asparaginyl beta-hydroxylase domain-containing protein [Myxococcaceae bacterium]
MQFNFPLLRLPRQYCANTLADEVAALETSAWVPHPGKLAGNDAVLLITPNGQMTNGFTGPMAPTEHLRRCPYIMEIMADLGAVWGRSRLMGLAPGSRVPPHVDLGYYWRTHLRIHIPIVTSPKVHFTCGDEQIHMAAGQCWTFDSFQMHNVHNGGSEKRIHLVLDTVGGDELWQLVAHAQQAEGGLAPLPPVLKPGETRTDGLAFERVNAPEIMSPWEVRCHIDYVLGHAPAALNRKQIEERLERFADGWAWNWAQYGPSQTGLGSYQRLLAQAQSDLTALGAGRIQLSNQVPLDRALSELIFRMAVPAPVARAA